MGITLTVEKMEFRQLTEEIKRTMRRSARDAVQLGFMLRRVMDECLWEAEHSSFDGYLQEELHMDYSLASRFMAINKKFSLRGNSMDINPEYQEYSQGALIEMLNMPSELEEKVTPEMTVREVREIKRQARREKKGMVSKQEETEVVIDGEYREVPQEQGEEVATSQGEISQEECDAYWFVRQYMEILPGAAETSIEVCCAEGDDSKRGKALQEYISPYGCNHIGCSEWHFDFLNFSKGVDMRIGTAKMRLAYNWFAKLLMEVGVERENKDKQNCTDEKLSAYGLMARKMEVEEQKSAREEAEQPELPSLRNTDQRKEWLRNYKAWGLWYRDENIDVNYYKYDFSDGSRLIVAEYPQRQAYWRKGTEDEYHFHLLEKGKKGYWDIPYDEKYRNEADSETRLVEFLKNIQKR